MADRASETTPTPCPRCGLVHSPFVACHEEEHQRVPQPTSSGAVEDQDGAIMLDLACYDRCSAEGTDAYMAGDPITACPYPRGSFEAGAWKDGYDG